MKPKKLALIHAISGYGHSTMSVILPVVSVMGVQGCPLPTAVFSNHTGFPSWYKLDFTQHMAPYANAWKQLNITFDGIYSGYLGSGEQCDTVLQLVQNQPDAIFFLDPVMGDHGKLYSAITSEHILAMKKLTACAQYILPNITEACVLTDTPYKTEFSHEELCDIIQKLHGLGPTNIVITGITQGRYIANYTSEKTGADNSIHRITTPVAGNSRPGTGDIFGAVVISSILKGQPLEHSVQKAVRFISDCIKISDENHLPITEGTCFELVLPTLLHQE